MKKVKIAFIGLMLLGFTAGVYAQDKAATTTDKKTKSTKSTSTKKTDATTKTDKTAPAKDSKGTSASGQHLKKDGTPDKRYKENKAVKSTKATKSDAK